MLGNFFERRRSHLELEARVHERTLELSAANSELESFAHTVSHDLKTPLRTINGFAQLLSAEYREVLDEEGHRYVDSIVGGTLRMSEVLEGLQRLSLVTATPLQRQSVDVSAVAREVAADLARTEPDRNVTFTIEQGLTAYGDGAMLRVVLANLLGNAWKYTGRRKVARIEVGARRESDGVEIFVRDDGAGFDQQYSDRLFRAFQRLHRPDEFEGTGLGLATVARIVRRHGGSVRAEGAPGHGATFYFTLGPRPA
jgi:light-regulated signal transduction histidine kinase (bacteriophytochrome)